MTLRFISEKPITARAGVAVKDGKTLDEGFLFSYRALDVSDATILRNIILTRHRDRDSIREAAEIMARSIVKLEGVKTDVTPDLLIRIENHAHFWDMAGRMILTAAVTEDEEKKSD